MYPYRSQQQQPHLGHRNGLGLTTPDLGRRTSMPAYPTTQHPHLGQTIKTDAFHQWGFPTASVPQPATHVVDPHTLPNNYPEYAPVPPLPLAPSLDHFKTSQTNPASAFPQPTRTNSFESEDVTAQTIGEKRKRGYVGSEKSDDELERRPSGPSSRDRRESGTIHLSKDDGSASPSSSQSKRPRLIKACQPCRLRKIGCDGKHPVCQRCQNDNRASECQFIKTIVRSSLTRKRMTELEEKLEAWDRFWNRLSGEQHVEGEFDPDELDNVLLSGNASGQELKNQIIQTLGGQNNSANGTHANGFALPAAPQPIMAPTQQTDIPYLGMNMPSQSQVDLHTLQPSLPKLDTTTTDQAPSAQPPATSRSKWTTAQVDTLLDGTASFARSGNGCSYLGLSSGMVFLNAILRLCKEKGGITIDVKSTLPPEPSQQRSTGPDGSKSVKTHEMQMFDTASALVRQQAVQLPPQAEYMPYVDSYFRFFHPHIPLVHEPTVRATLTGRIPFPKSDAYLALIYMIFAMGALDGAHSESDFQGHHYYEIARAILSVDVVEGGSLERVQAVAILANYLQRSDKPDAGYLWLGAGLRLAIGMGLHVHDSDSKLSPLEAENRKRVWWCMVLLESGCSKTFGRPSGLCGIPLSQIPLPVNIDDECLTPTTAIAPQGVTTETLYSTLIAHSKLACTTTDLHIAILQQQPAPTLEQIRQYDQQIIQVIQSLPVYITDASIPVRYNFSRLIILWRLRDWRATLYRPILLAAAWDQVKEKHLSPGIVQAILICRTVATENLNEQGDYIQSIQSRDPTRAEEWYCMYFAHQSSLILLLSLIGEPAHPEAEQWRQTILRTAAWFRKLRAMTTGGLALASILESVVYATADMSVSESTTNSTPSDTWLGAMHNVDDGIDVLRYWNALCPDGTAPGSTMWDESIWNSMFSFNPEAMGPS